MSFVYELFFGHENLVEPEDNIDDTENYSKSESPIPVNKDQNQVHNTDK